MTRWIITWFDGMRLRETIVTADAYNLITNAGAQGVYNPNAIIKIEQVPTP